jgi:flagellar protein FlbD
VIIVQRLTGQAFALNPDLIERIESTPDTIVVLLDGTRYIVAGTLEEIVDLVVEYRATVVARSLVTGDPPGAEAAVEVRSDTVIPLPLRTAGD